MQANTVCKQACAASKAGRMTRVIRRAAKLGCQTVKSPAPTQSSGAHLVIGHDVAYDEVSPRALGRGGRFDCLAAKLRCTSDDTCHSTCLASCACLFADCVCLHTITLRV